MEQKTQSLFNKPWVQTLTGISTIIILFISVLVYRSISSHITIDRSIISAPIISLSPSSSGILDEINVVSGETVTVGQTIARIGGETISAKVAGTIIDIENTPGQVFTPSQAVAKMIDPTQLRVVGTIKETEGLSDIKVGQSVSFTVDAFSGKTYVGIVESISPTSKESGITFSISDKREVKEFDVTVKYDIAAYPEFKNGMSAKMKVYKN